MNILRNDFQYNLIRNESYVKETDLSKKGHNKNIWNIKELSSIELIFNVENKPELIKWAESFKRTRKWIQENYPELMI
jgi:hypothetical protein